MQKKAKKNKPFFRAHPVVSPHWPLWYTFGAGIPREYISLKKLRDQMGVRSNAHKENKKDQAKIRP